MHNETRSLLYVDFAVQKEIFKISLTFKGLKHVDACLVIRMSHNKYFKVKYIRADPVMNPTVYGVNKSVVTSDIKQTCRYQLETLPI